VAAEVVMPKFGLTMVEGTIQKWFKKEGEAITKGEALFEVETEKVLYEVESTVAGTVAKLLYPLESVVAVGLPIAVIAEAGEDVATVAAGYAGAPTPQAGTSPAGSPTPGTGSAAAAPASAPAPVAAARDGKRVPTTPAARKLAVEHNIDTALIAGTGPGGRITREDIQKVIDTGGQAPATAPGSGKRAPVTPAARKLAAEHNIDASLVSGTGPGGRITREDIQKVIDAGGQAPASAAAPASAGESIPLRGMRKVIAERMHTSLQASAQLTITTEVDVTQLIEQREEVKREFNTTYNDFIIQACAHALIRHPRMNASLEGDAIQLHDARHVGFAVALDEGLIVPVVRDADKKPLKTIAEEARALAEKARAGKLQLEEVSGGTFTVSNLGMAGVDAFTPILNSPQTGILGIGRIIEKPVVFQGEIAKRSMLVLSLTFDHRVIDGAPAGAFLQSVADLLSHGNRIALAVS
jgi:pyruvate dehydrogenase E2 component (dihydrolipoamide acetyltransferase)